MVKSLKNLLSCFVCIVLISNLPVSVFASTSDIMSKEINSSSQSIENIINKINDEYGTEFYIPDSSNSLKTSGLDNSSMLSYGRLQSMKLTDLQLQEFEKNLRKSANKIASLDNTQKIYLQKSDKSDSNMASKAAYYRTISSGYVYTNGARFYFEGWVNNYNGWWQFESFNYTDVQTDFNNSWCRFVWNGREDFRFLDGRRTCLVSYSGTLHVKTYIDSWNYFWVPYGFTQHIEWYA